MGCISTTESKNKPDKKNPHPSSPKSSDRIQKYKVPEDDFKD